MPLKTIFLNQPAPNSEIEVFGGTEADHGAKQWVELKQVKLRPTIN